MIKQLNNLGHSVFRNIDYPKSRRVTITTLVVSIIVFIALLILQFTVLYSNRTTIISAASGILDSYYDFVLRPDIDPGNFVQNSIESFNKNSSIKYMMRLYHVDQNAISIENGSLLAEGRSLKPNQFSKAQNGSFYATEFGVENGHIIQRTSIPVFLGASLCDDCSWDELRERVGSSPLALIIIEDDLSSALYMAFIWSLGTFVIVFAGQVGFQSLFSAKPADEAPQSIPEEIVVSSVVPEDAISDSNDHYDSLTGLFDRATFQGKISAAVQEHEDAMLILIEISNFDSVIESFGDDFGDYVVKSLTENLRSELLQYSGRIGRLAINEFGIIISDAAETLDTTYLGLALARKLSAPLSYEGRQICPLVYIGIATTKELASKSEVALTSAATHALLSAREKPESAFNVYDKHLSSQIARRRELALAIPEAIRSDSFELFYQPQIHLASGNLRGFEALARWRRENDILSPIEFIPIAEDAGLIRQLDMQVLLNAAKQIKTWSEKGLKDITISVNMSAHHLNDDQFPDRTISILNEVGIEKNHIVLEFKETSILKNWASAQAVISALGIAGIRISLDNFGTGYSSMSFLPRINADEIKIDQSLVTDIENSQEVRLIFKSISQIVSGLEKTVIVEGIENTRQRELAAQYGAEIGQGFFFGHPMPISDAETYIRNTHT